MSTPTSPSSASPATPGSPYQPLSEPQPTCDLHSLFCQQTRIPPLSSTTPASLEATPSCSYAVTSSPSSSATSSTANRTSSSSLKRLLEESSGSSEPPRKRRCKRNNIESSTSPQSTSPKRKRSSSSSSSEEEENGELQNKRLCDPKVTRRPAGVHTWLWASRFTFGAYRAARGQINYQVLARIQADLCSAAQSLEDEDKAAAEILNSIYASQAPIAANRLPIVLFKRRLRSPTRLCWKKLHLALSHLSCCQNTGTVSRIGQDLSTRAIHWLSSFIKQVTPLSQRPRTLMSGAAFTRLCGQALAAQHITPDRTPPAPLTSKNSLKHLASGDDLALAMDDINHINQEYGLVFLRNNDGTREIDETQRQRRSTYPIYDFDTSNASNEPPSTSSQTEGQS